MSTDRDSSFGFGCCVRLSRLARQRGTPHWKSKATLLGRLDVEGEGGRRIRTAQWRSFVMRLHAPGAERCDEGGMVVARRPLVGGYRLARVVALPPTLLPSTSISTSSARLTETLTAGTMLELLSAKEGQSKAFPSNGTPMTYFWRTSDVSELPLRSECLPWDLSTRRLGKQLLSTVPTDSSRSACPTPPPPRHPQRYPHPNPAPTAYDTTFIMPPPPHPSLCAGARATPTSPSACFPFLRPICVPAAGARAGGYAHAHRAAEAAAYSPPFSSSAYDYTCNGHEMLGSDRRARRRLMVTKKRKTKKCYMLISDEEVEIEEDAADDEEQQERTPVCALALATKPSSISLIDDAQDRPPFLAHSQQGLLLPLAHVPVLARPHPFHLLAHPFHLLCLPARLLPPLASPSSSTHKLEQPTSPRSANATAACPPSPCKPELRPTSPVSPNAAAAGAIVRAGARELAARERPARCELKACNGVGARASLRATKIPIHHRTRRFNLGHRRRFGWLVRSGKPHFPSDHPRLPRARGRIPVIIDNQFRVQIYGVCHLLEDARISVEGGKLRAVHSRIANRVSSVTHNEPHSLRKDGLEFLSLQVRDSCGWAHA
ncbi:hypothetical protein FB451DRAFT_1169995 [Mycena latifolia]|nr:hypothetical protein FB451DRAFT_1169995 [Mycena latifolia]